MNAYGEAVRLLISGMPVSTFLKLMSSLDGRRLVFRAFSSSLVGGVSISGDIVETLSARRPALDCSSVCVMFSNASWMMGSWSTTPLDLASSLPIDRRAVHVPASFANDVASSSHVGRGGQERRRRCGEGEGRGDLVA